MNFEPNPLIEHFFPSSARDSHSTSPILISSLMKNEKSPGINIVLLSTNSTSEKTEIETPSYRIINDFNCFYKISNHDSISLLTKIRMNKNCWPMPVFSLIDLQI